MLHHLPDLLRYGIKIGRKMYGLPRESYGSWQTSGWWSRSRRFSRHVAGGRAAQTPRGTAAMDWQVRSLACTETQTGRENCAVVDGPGQHTASGKRSMPTIWSCCTGSQVTCFADAPAAMCACQSATADRLIQRFDNLLSNIARKKYFYFIS